MGDLQRGRMAIVPNFNKSPLARTKSAIAVYILFFFLLPDTLQMGTQSPRRFGPNHGRSISENEIHHLWWNANFFEPNGHTYAWCMTFNPIMKTCRRPVSEMYQPPQLAPKQNVQKKKVEALKFTDSLFLSMWISRLSKTCFPSSQPPRSQKVQSQPLSQETKASSWGRGTTPGRQGDVYQVAPSHAVFFSVETSIYSMYS